MEDWQFVISFIISIALAYWNFKQSKRIESLKNELHQQLYVHKLQFETEFNTYKEVWSSITELRKKSEALRPIADQTEEGKTYSETIRGRLKGLYIASNKTVTQILRYEPFYPLEVKERLMNIVVAIRTEMNSAEPYEDDPQWNRDYWKNKPEFFKKIEESISEASFAIRKRIGTDRNRKDFE